MGSEVLAAPQPLQVLHVPEQEEDVFALGVGLKQPAKETKRAQAEVGDPSRAGLCQQQQQGQVDPCRNKFSA